MSASTKQNSIYLQFVCVLDALVSVRVKFCDIETENPVFGFQLEFNCPTPPTHRSESVLVSTFGFSGAEVAAICYQLTGPSSALPHTRSCDRRQKMIFWPNRIRCSKPKLITRKRQCKRSKKKNSLISRSFSLSRRRQRQKNSRFFFSIAPRAVHT